MITYFHRNLNSGFSIAKVSNTLTSRIHDKEEFYVPSSGASFFSLIRNIWYVYRHRNVKGINHITGDIHYCALALIGCKSVLTIHDTVLLDYQKTSKLKKILIKLLWFDIPLAIVDKVVCISYETKKKLERYSKRRDIIVIHNMIPDSFELLNNYNKPRDVEDGKILIIGTTPNKNIPRVLYAIKGLNVTVTIIGELSDEMLSIINLYKINCINKMRLTDKEIVEEYKWCDIVVFCSLFEGFGMPILESNASGRALLCSDIQIMHEVAGDSALFVNPEDVNSIAEGLSTLLYNKESRSRLIENGYLNIKRFSPEIILPQWLALYNSL